MERDPEMVIATRRRGILAVHERLTARRDLEIGEDPQNRGLPTPRGSEERGERTHGRREVDALERDDLRPADAEDLPELTQRDPVVGDDPRFVGRGVGTRQGVGKRHSIRPGWSSVQDARSTPH